jgi:hypothetical protein
MSNPAERQYARGGLIEGSSGPDQIARILREDHGYRLSAAQVKQLGLGQDLLRKLNEYHPCRVGNDDVQPG